MYRVPLSYTPIDAIALSEVLRRYQDRHHNDLITDFESAVRDITGAKYALALNSGTAAIHLGLKVLGVGAGDDVIVSTFTYVASVNPILYLGARPVFVDSERHTWNLDPDLLEEAINQRKQRLPKAIVVVHGYGMPAQMDRVLAVANRYGIPVLEDAAEALGSTYRGQHVGTLGNAGILSFNNNKIITSYGGGILLTDDEMLFQQALRFASQSRADELFYHHEKVGYSYRMGPINAAVGLAQLTFLERYVNWRRLCHAFYREKLAGRGLAFVEEPDEMVSNRWLSTVVLEDSGLTARDIVDRLGKEGIEARYLWNPMHRQPLFKDYPYHLHGYSEHLFSKGFCLPMGIFPEGDLLGLPGGQQEYVVQKLAELTRR